MRGVGGRAQALVAVLLTTLVSLVLSQWVGYRAIALVYLFVITTLALVLLFWPLIGRALVITANASTMFARLVAGAVTLTFERVVTIPFLSSQLDSEFVSPDGAPFHRLAAGADHHQRCAV